MKSPRGARTLACRVATLGDMSSDRTAVRISGTLRARPTDSPPTLLAVEPMSPRVATRHARVRAPRRTTSKHSVPLPIPELLGPVLDDADHRLCAGRVFDRRGDDEPLPVG